MGLLGKAMGTGARIGNSVVRGTTSVLGVGALAAQHPFITTAAIAALVAVGGYSSTSRMGVPVGPLTYGNNPATPGSTTDYNLGATGDLVFALHRNR